MRIYLAGNFPQMVSVQSEQAVVERILPKHDYRRLVSYYYADPWSQNVIEAIRLEHALEMEKK